MGRLSSGLWGLDISDGFPEFIITLLLLNLMTKEVPDLSDMPLFGLFEA